ncbi:MAG: hypothetical protein H6678_10055 [Candidatus Delongbacteria bacterium]|nr:hypothetical protein [Candidatus Delongbacteria bacterium]
MIRFLLPLLAGALCASAQVYTTYMWHLHQPVYWPQPSALVPGTYEVAWESIQRRNAGAQHPENDVAQIFSLADRQAAYQYRIKDSIALMSGTDSGAQVSYSGSLAENVASLGSHSSYGYGPLWAQNNRIARNWTTSGGLPRLDLVIFPYHHSLAPLIDENALRMEIRLGKLAHTRDWGSTPGLSQGFFPPEMAFSTRMIQVLAEEGVQWSFVSNSHLSRAVSNFPLILGTGGENCTPPNKADQLNPPQSQWFSRTISRGCTPTNAVPFAFRPHWARSVDPETGQEHRLVVVPVEMAMSWLDGYQTYGTQDIDQIAAASEPSQPMLIALAHDGDNAFGGGYSYYHESVPGFTAQAVSHGYTPTVVQQYLADHPVALNDVVHVEDGAWVNADGDFGDPDYINWNWPLVGSDGQFDIAAGWAEDERNWAVITAAQNWVDTAEQMSGGVDPARVMNPLLPGTTEAERAWHHFLPGIASDFMYYGAALDMEVKATITANAAIGHALNVVGDGTGEQTPPTIWLPQQLPHNPGEVDFGPLWGYQQRQSPRDFWVWTFVHDVSGLGEVNFRYRIDLDGQNPLSSDQNETYAGGAEVGSWRSLPMTARDFPVGNVTNSPEIDFFELPLAIATQYSIHVQEEELVASGGVLIDYYVEARDTNGLLKKSPILHTWIGTGQGSGGGGGDRVSWLPEEPQAGQSLAIHYDAALGPLPANTSAVYLHHGFDGWSSVVSPDLAMSAGAEPGTFTATVSLPSSISQLDFVFTDGAGNWDSNSGQDWHLPVSGAVQSWQLDGQLDPGAELVAQDGGRHLWVGWQDPQLYLATEPASVQGGDAFLMLFDGSADLLAAPWAKAGQTASLEAFLAQEVDNGWSGWFDAASAANASGAVLEGVIDLRAQFASLPETVRLALAVYATANGGALLDQLPTGNGNASIELSESVLYPLASGTGIPAPVTNLRIVAFTNGAVELSWDPVTTDTAGFPLSVDGYTVYLSPDPYGAGPGWIPWAETAQTQLTHSNAQWADGALFYRVTARVLP